MPKRADLPPGAIGPPWWDEGTVYVVGGGPSAAGFDLQALRGHKVLACNDSALALPWATAVISCDRGWMSRRADFLAGFEGEKLLIADDARDYPEIPGATWLASAPVTFRPQVLSEDPGVICHGGNTGFSALGAAYLKRARRIVLLGFDMVAAGHWHGGYAWSSADDARYFKGWASAFDATLPQLRAAGIVVLNANPASAITAFAFDATAAPRMRVPA